jgi:hypothetical protein
MSWESTTLTAVQTLITNIIAGGATASYSWNGRSWSRENLSDLMKLRAQLQGEVAAQNATSEFLLAQFQGSGGHQRFGVLG